MLRYKSFADPLLVIFEYIPNGDLLGYLKKSRNIDDDYHKDPHVKPQTSLTTLQFLKFSSQIADGMEYLSSKEVIFFKKKIEKEQMISDSFPTLETISSLFRQ